MTVGVTRRPGFSLSTGDNVDEDDAIVADSMTDSERVRRARDRRVPHAAAATTAAAAAQADIFDMKCQARARATPAALTPPLPPR